MHCLECGTKLPEDAKFCYNCGTPVGKTGSSPIKDQQWEYCEVGLKHKETWWSGRWPAAFIADAVSPVKGQYVALKSREVASKSDIFLSKSAEVFWNNAKLYLMNFQNN